MPSRKQNTPRLNLRNVITFLRNFFLEFQDFLYCVHVIYKSTCPETTSPWWNHLWTIQARLSQQPPFSQHVSWRCYNPLDILSSMVEILLFNSVFHDGVTPVSVSTLKPPLGEIGVLPLKPQASPILSVCI